MNNLKKVGLTALAGSLVAGSVSAADLSVTVLLLCRTAVEIAKHKETVGQWLTQLHFLLQEM